LTEKALVLAVVALIAAGTGKVTADHFNQTSINNIISKIFVQR
jgi:hypothetical protein